MGLRINYLDNYLNDNGIDKDFIMNLLDAMDIDYDCCSDLLFELDNRKYKRNLANLNHFIYWLGLNRFIDNNVDCFDYQPAFPRSVYRISLGRKNYIEIQRNVRVSLVAVHVNIRDKDKDIFDYFLDFRDEIEEIVGEELLWDRRDGEILSKISYSYVIDINNVNNWEMAIEWQVKLAEKLYLAFKPLLDDYYS